MSRLEWPRGFGRTDPSEREKNRAFDVSLSQAFDDLEAELRRLGLDPEDYRYSFDARQRKKDQRPYARANPDDPSFVLRWKMDGNQYAVACDQYSRLRDNVRTVGYYISEKRKMEDRPVRTGASEFANARLPPGDDAASSAGEAVVARPAGEPEAHEVLGVEPDAPDAAVRGAYRGLVKEKHPDHGGSEAEVRRLNKAKEQLLGDS